MAKINPHQKSGKMVSRRRLPTDTRQVSGFRLPFGTGREDCHRGSAELNPRRRGKAKPNFLTFEARRQNAMILTIMKSIQSSIKKCTLINSGNLKLLLPVNWEHAAHLRHQNIIHIEKGSL
jgi:hypothetical protein